MVDYYRVLYREDECLGVGYLATVPDHHPCFQAVGRGKLFFLPDRGTLEKWKPLTLELREGEFPDYLANDLGCRLCSERLKNILDRHASPGDALQWLPVEVMKDGQSRLYFILHFPDPPDVLDRQRSIFAGEDCVVKPVLARALVGDHRVFTYRKSEGLPLFVAEDVKLDVESARCTGVEFSRLPVR